MRTLPMMSLHSACRLPRRTLFVAMLASIAGTLALPAGGIAAGSCPNEAVRSESHSDALPDCRGYELVSPAAKNGNAVTVVSASETHAVFYSLGSFAGGKSTGLLDYYFATRGTGGWATSPLEIPLGTAQVQPETLMNQSRSGEEGLFEYHPAAASTLDVGIYERHLPAGADVPIGPLFSPAVIRENPPNSSPTTSTLGASRDLSHVAFEIAGESGGRHLLWPGDTTVRNSGPLWGGQAFVSLYAYSGVGNTEPALVGLDNQGELISQCGTVLGSPGQFGFAGLQSADTFNAISADGSRVFFTAAAATQGPSSNACTGSGAGHGPPVNELFARTGGAETTDLSEPTESQCAECSTPATVAAGRRDAVFQGASEDGTKVYFLSEQELLPGAKGRSLFEYDFAAPEGARVSLIAANVSGVARVAENGARVYFVSTAVLPTAPNSSLASGHQMPVLGGANLYIYTRDAATPGGRTGFAGTLLPGDSPDWDEDDERPVDASEPDGRYLVFTSAADLTQDDTSSAPQVFEYDAETEQVVRVSVGQNAFNNNGNTSQYGASIAHPNFSANPVGAPPQTSVSDDGSVVAFQSEDALTPTALQGYNNIYEYHAGHVSLISDGQDRTFRPGLPPIPSTMLVGIDASAQDIFFETADALTPQDGDTQIDVYDARRDGGFPAPAVPAECEGEACRGIELPSPTFSTALSATQPAGEQIAAPTPPQATAKPHSKPRRKKRHSARRKRRNRATHTVKNGRRR